MRFYCKPIINADGSLDLLTELFVKLMGSRSDLTQLKMDTAEAFDGAMTVHADKDPSVTKAAMEEEMESPLDDAVEADEEVV